VKTRTESQKKGVEKGLHFARNMERRWWVVSLIQRTPALSRLRGLGAVGVGASLECICVPVPPIATCDVSRLWTAPLRCLGSRGPMMAEQTSGQMQLAPMAKLLHSHVRSP
jgi:hypothetical protein